MANTCYICGEKATSKEHAPARCFFPEDEKYRKNLIVVPSCSKHNEATSIDDEYVRDIICMSIGNNSVAYKQFIDKVIKSFTRRPALQVQILKNTRPVYIKEKTNNIDASIALEIDRDRFDKILKKIAYAIYYNEYSKIWKRGLIIATDFLLDSQMKPDEVGELMREVRQYLKEPEFDGNNPQVFKYKFLETNTTDVILWMKFYEGFEAFAIPNLGNNQPDLV